ncbi:MAG: hypothetical protein R3338_10915 [Thermoanaerobaculia bacterium]|nr:hypothetical protein [Thermoanaerobaculia bacterium]
MINEEDFEDQIEDLILENGMLTQALINLLVRKGVLTETEIAEEVDKLYGSGEEGALPAGGLTEFASGEED